MLWFATKKDEDKAPAFDWYQAASPEQRSEYDAFGPWMATVGAEAELPRRFRPYWSEVSSASLLLKVPQDVERRHARPGDDLYRAVLAVFDDRLSVLSLAGGQVSRRTVWHGQIGAIGHGTLLLAGELVLTLTDAPPFTFVYNTSSAPVMQQLVDHIRRLVPKGIAASMDPPPRVAPPKHFYLRGQYEAWGHRTPGHVPVFAEEPGPRRLPPGLLVFASADEASFVSLKGAARAKPGSPYGSSTVHVFRHAVTAVAGEPAEHEKGRRRGLWTLRLGLGEGALEFALAAAPTGLVDQLSRWSGLSATSPDKVGAKESS
jgi:hypothetical protein